jgi:hypothetical protein
MEAINTIDEMLIREAKTYLDGYHIDLSKYVTVVVDTTEFCASIRFTSDESGQSIYVDNCYYNETEILQADIHF